MKKLKWRDEEGWSLWDQLQIWGYGKWYKIMGPPQDMAKILADLKAELKTIKEDKK